MSDRLFLINLKEGDIATIVSVNGGRGVVQRLTDMGLTPGTEIKVIKSAALNGPIEISVRSSKLVIGRGVAAKVHVKRK